MVGQDIKLTRVSRRREDGLLMLWRLCCGGRREARGVWRLLHFNP